VCAEWCIVVRCGHPSSVEETHFWARNHIFWRRNCVYSTGNPYPFILSVRYGHPIPVRALQCRMRCVALRCNATHQVRTSLVVDVGLGLPVIAVRLRVGWPLSQPTEKKRTRVTCTVDTFAFRKITFRTEKWVSSHGWSHSMPS